MNLYMEGSKTNKRLKKNSPVFDYSIVIIIISTFVFNDITRHIFGAGSMLHRTNIIFLAISLLFFILKIKTSQINWLLFYICTIFSSLLILNSFFNEVQMNLFYYVSLLVSTFIIPVYYMSIKLDKVETLGFFERFVSVFNIFIIILIVMGLLDYFLGSKIQLFLANTIFQNSGVDTYIYGEHIWGVYRYYSIFGLPLTMAKYFLIFYSINMIYAKYINKFKMNKYLIFIITVIGILLSASKMAIVLCLILFIFCRPPLKYKGLYYSIVIIGLIFASSTQVFQKNVKERFIQGIERGDLTTGRNTLIESLIANDSIEKPDWFIGKGANHSYEIATNLAVKNIYNFEYPFLMWPYDYGIIATILFYLILFIYPIVIFIRKKQFYILFNFLIISIMVNTNNGLATLGTDYTAQFSILVFLLLSIVRDFNPSKKVNCE
ncbi:hypothetical protein [Bacillus sp. BP-3]|uniref:hypothetical protein n=1 Tax=Bacillus sp. BP-3 TaxID=3022773 RepID=UPI00232E5EED|nr:hypothetical protein [Bacillus sp. BP-3]MDC2866201.1 hypothetical protein [Bacillus sp. BP-3]